MKNSIINNQSPFIENLIDNNQNNF